MITRTLYLAQIMQSLINLKFKNDFSSYLPPTPSMRNPNKETMKDWIMQKGESIR